MNLCLRLHVSFVMSPSTSIPPSKFSRSYRCDGVKACVTMIQKWSLNTCRKVCQDHSTYLSVKSLSGIAQKALARYLSSHPILEVSSLARCRSSSCLGMGRSVRKQLNAYQISITLTVLTVPYSSDRICKISRLSAKLHPYTYVITILAVSTVISLLDRAREKLRIVSRLVPPLSSLEVRSIESMRVSFRLRDYVYPAQIRYSRHI